jgi:hypothetical protein
MANNGQQSRLAFKLKRNLEQVFLASESFTFEIVFNGYDHLVKVTDGGAGTDSCLIKFKQIDVNTFTVPGLHHHKVCILADTTATVGVFAEIVARVKELGCGIEVYTHATPLTQDDASAAGIFSGAVYKRFVRGSVDTLNVGQ